MMSKNIFLIICSLLLSTSLLAQQTIKSSNLEKFTSIELSGNLSSELIASGSESIEIELIDGDITRLKWSVENGVLKIALRASSSAEKTTRANVVINYSELEKIKISGGSLRTTGVIHSDLFDLDASSEAIVNLQTQCLDIDVVASQNSVVQIAGTTKYLTVTSSDKSKLDMRSLSSVSANISASSVSEVFVFPLQRLVAKARTGATVHYKGEPIILRALTSKVVKFGAKVSSLEE